VLVAVVVVIILLVFKVHVVLKYTTHIWFLWKYRLVDTTTK